MRMRMKKRIEYSPASIKIQNISPTDHEFKRSCQTKKLQIERSPKYTNVFLEKALMPRRTSEHKSIIRWSPGTLFVCPRPPYAMDKTRPAKRTMHERVRPTLQGTDRERINQCLT